MSDRTIGILGLGIFGSSVLTALAQHDTCDTVVVATGENLESSVLAVMHCKSLGVPTVIAKVKSHTAKKVLEKIGADSVISPEFEMGRSLAQTILFNNSVDVFQLDKNVSIVEMKIPQSWAGKSLSESRWLYDGSNQ